MKCYNHPNKDAVGQCKNCGKFICRQDSVEVARQLYCRDCAAAGLTSAGASQGPAQASVPQGAAPASASQAPESSGAPVNKKSAAVALLLAIIPAFVSLCGIGQMYDGRMKRGLAILIAGWCFLAANLLGSLVVVGICITGPLTFIFFLWQAYDAYKLAKEYNEYSAKNGKAPW